MKSLQDITGEHQGAEVSMARLRESSVGCGRRNDLSPEVLFVMGGIAHRYRDRPLRAETAGPG